MTWRSYRKDAPYSAARYVESMAAMRRQRDEAAAAEREHWELVELEAQCARMFGYLVEFVQDEVIFLNVNPRPRA